MENETRKISGNAKANRGFFKRIFDYFLQGLLYVVPIVITLYVIYLVFQFIDGIVQVYLDKILPIHIPGIGIIIIFILITIFGFIGHFLISTPLRLVFEKSISRAPLIQMVYSSIRDLISAFVGKEKKFTQPVLVKLEKNVEIQKMGFITANDLSKLGLTDKVAVYFPYAYAFMGEMLIVPSDIVTPLQINSSEAMKFIVSGGVTKLNEGEEKNKEN
jgi:uncharacterized membrane protein